MPIAVDDEDRMSTSVGPPHVWLIGAVIALTLVRLWLAWHLELTGEEGFLWLLTDDPAIGYFDVQPMAVWWVGVGRLILGDSEIAVRLFAVISLLPTTYFAYRTHLLLFGDARRARAGVVWLQATAFAAIGGVVMTPGAPLVLFTTIAVFGAAQILRTGVGRWWYLVGAAVGLAMLSRYSAVFVGLGIVMWLVLVADLRHWLASRDFVLGVAIAALVSAPNVAWQIQNEWPALLLPFERMLNGEIATRFIGDFLGAQLGLLTPVIFVFCVTAVAFVAHRGFVERRPAWALIAATVVPLIAAVLAYALFERLPADWAAPTIPMLIIAAVEIAFDENDRGLRRAVRQSSLRLAAPIGLLACAFLYAQAAFDLVPDRGTNDPTARMKGWKALAETLGSIAEVEGAAFIATTDYRINAVLAFYLGRDLPVFEVVGRHRYGDLAVPPEDAYDRPGLYVVQSKKDARGVLQHLFDEVLWIGELERRRPGAVVERLNVYRLRHPRVVPPFADKGAPDHHARRW